MKFHNATHLIRVTHRDGESVRLWCTYNTNIWHMGYQATTDAGKVTCRECLRSAASGVIELLSHART